MVKPFKRKLIFRSGKAMAKKIKIDCVAFWTRDRPCE